MEEDEDSSEKRESSETTNGVLEEVVEEEARQIIRRWEGVCFWAQEMRFAATETSERWRQQIVRTFSSRKIKVFLYQSREMTVKGLVVEGGGFGLMEDGRRGGGQLEGSWRAVGGRAVGRGGWRAGRLIGLPY